MHYHVLRTDTKISRPGVERSTDVGISPSYRAGADVIAADKRRLHSPAVLLTRVGIIATWSRFSCDNQAHE